MKYFAGALNFDNEMEIVYRILSEKGYVLESDHAYAYSMQYKAAFDDVKEWLYSHGYEGTLNNAGAYDGVAVYGLYDETRITWEEMRRKLLIEAKAQFDVESEWERA